MTNSRFFFEAALMLNQTGSGRALAIFPRSEINIGASHNAYVLSLTVVKIKSKHMPYLSKIILKSLGSGLNKWVIVR